MSLSLSTPKWLFETEGPKLRKRSSAAKLALTAFFRVAAVDHTLTTYHFIL